MRYTAGMYEVAAVVTRGGHLALDGIPFDEGQPVRVSIVAASERPRLTIAEAQRIVAGSTDQLDDPGEPMVPLDAWEPWEW